MAMENVFGALQKRLITKKLSEHGLGAMLVQRLKGSMNFPDEIRGKYQRGILTVYVDPKEDRTQLFIKKSQIIRDLNSHLEDLSTGYKIRDIQWKIVRKELIVEEHFSPNEEVYSLENHHPLLDDEGLNKCSQ